MTFFNMRSGKRSLKALGLLAVAASICGQASAQISFADAGRRGSVYLSVGNGSPSHKPSTISIVQGTPGNISNYKLSNVEGDNSTTKAISGIYNYNIRLGYFFDYNQNYAFELCFDPVKYHVSEGQIVNMTGTRENKDIDTSFAFSPANGYFYNIDGANFLSVNLVRRIQIYQIKSHNVRIDGLAKVGIGPCMPHTYSSIAGKEIERPSFQWGGWNAGGEAALRLTLMRHIFLEASYKYSYASYKDIAVYNGTAAQKLVTSQMVFSLGYWFSTTKHNPLFEKPDNRPAPLTIKPIYPPDPEEDSKKMMQGQPMMKAPAAPAQPVVPTEPAPAPTEPAPGEPTPTPDAPPAPAPEPEPGK
ncbi:hypothetical protein [Nemorincola caseinilytica]